MRSFRLYGVAAYGIVLALGGLALASPPEGGYHLLNKYDLCAAPGGKEYDGCQNDLYVRWDDLEDLLLGKLQSELLQPEVVDYAVMEFQRQLEAALASLSGDLAEMRQRKTRLEAEVRRLVSAVAESGHSKSILEEIGRKEAELRGIGDRLLSATPESIESRVSEIRSYIKNGLSDLRNLLRKDTALARTELLKHSSEITMTPHRGPARRFYVADGNWDLLGKDDWPEGASRQAGGFGWLRGLDWSFDNFAPMEAIPTAVSLTTYAGESEDFMRTPLEDLVEKIAAGTLHVQIGKTFHLDEIAEAHRCMEENKAGGKIVVLT